VKQNRSHPLNRIQPLPKRKMVEQVEREEREKVVVKGDSRLLRLKK